MRNEELSHYMYLLPISRFPNTPQSIHWFKNLERLYNRLVVGLFVRLFVVTLTTVLMLLLHLKMLTDDEWLMFHGCLWSVSGLYMDCLWTVSGCLWNVSRLSLDCLWTVFGLSLVCLWTVSGPTDWLYNWIFPRYDCFILYTTGFVLSTTGMVLNMTGIVLNMIRFVLNMTGLVLNVTEFVLNDALRDLESLFHNWKSYL